MKDLSVAEGLYEALGQDSNYWLKQAMFLKGSAEHLLNFIQAGTSFPDSEMDVEATRMAFAQSYMLLTGFAFENVIKGADITLHGGMSIPDRLKKWNKHRGGHGLSQLCLYVMKINKDEENLLLRLEEFSFWAGRYPIPTNARQLLEGAKHRHMHVFDDPELANSLFERLSDIIRFGYDPRP